MNRNLIIVLAGAILIAFAVAFIVQLSFEDKGNIQVIVEEKVKILVATKNLPIGAELSEGDAIWHEWPKSSVFTGAIVRKDKEELPSDALSGRLGRSIAKGEPLLSTAILGFGDGNFVAAALKPNMRAVAIKVSASSMVGGFIGPNDYVDVILTYKQKINVDDDDPRVQEMLGQILDKLATETIIQNVKVLAVDQAAQRSDDNKVKVGKTVTLAVGARQAEQLALAAEMGDLTLVLRGVGDDTIIEKEWPITSDARLTKVDDEILEEYKKLKKDSGSKGQNVRIYSGAQVQDTSE